MKGEWTTCTLADVAAKTRNAIVGGPFGSDLVSRDYVGIGVPVIRGVNMANRWVGGEFAFVSAEKSESLAANHAEPGDIVFTQRGTLGQVALVPDKPYARYLVSQSQMKITVDRQKASPLFLYYVFHSEEQQGYIRKNAIQTGVPHTNLGLLKATPLVLPPLTEQRAIARILGTLDDKIELNRKTNATLEAMARALFKSWFVDFDPVRAKAEGRAPSGMDAETAKLFPSEFVESDMGPIPKGWRMRPVLELANLISGGTPNTSNSEYWDGSIKWASAKDVSQCGSFFLTSTERSITEAGLEGSSTKVIPKDAVVVVARGATCGRFTVFAEPIAMNQTCYALSAKAASARWYMRFLADGLFTKLVAQAHGSVFDTITTNTFRSAVVIDPGGAPLHTFEVLVSPFIERIRQLHYESDALASIRDKLLPRLISGEVPVDAAELAIEEVA